jgi:transitional endoplasmic reticulum ATPase
MARIAADSIDKDDIITGDEIEFRTDELQLFTLPREMTYSKAIKIFEAKREEESRVSNFTKIFKYRCYDGAVATAVVLKSRYGITMGKDMMTMFGPQPPQVLEVPIGPNGKTVQAPWGLMSIPVLDNAEVYLTGTNDRDLGEVFAIKVEAKKRYEKEVQAFFADVSEQLKNGSIYRGKAVAGASRLDFIEGLESFDPSQIVVAQDVKAQLDVALVAAMRYPHSYRAEKIPLKRAVLVHGPYGTGKTSIGQMLAKEAVANGWTFVMARPGRDSVQDVLQTARLYAPAVVWIEDVDVETSGSSNPRKISEMLDAFDGITAKGGGEIMVALSSNFIQRIPPGMLRPGRLDYVIEIAELDAPATEELLRKVIDPNKMGEIDFDAVHEQMCEPKAPGRFLPAFVKATADRARSFAINRIGGELGYRLETEDLVYAAKSLHAQLKLHKDAADPEPLPTFDRVLRDTITDTVDDFRVLDDDGDPAFTLRRPQLEVGRSAARN